MRIRKVAGDMIEKYFSIGTVVQESSATDRKVQVEGDRDETEAGKELWRAVRNLGPGGFKHRAQAGAEVLVFEFPWGGSIGVILGIEDDTGAPTDLEPGETAMFSPADSTGKSCVRCTSTRIEIGSGPGGLMLRKDRFETWYDAGPRANHLLHVHPGVMGGPASTGVTVTDLGAVGNIECDEDHRVK
jgi:hypothetical protein